MKNNLFLLLCFGMWLTACQSNKQHYWTKNAQWIGVETKEYRDTLGHAILPARYLKQTFVIDQTVQEAQFYLAVGGYADAFINSQPITNEVFGPLPTNYDRSLLFRSYDVTSLLKKDTNTIQIRLASGYFTGMLGKYRMPDWGVPRVKAALVIKTDNGSITIPTNTSWQASDQGPIRSNNLYDGETYDARYEEITHWKKADKLPSPKGTLQEQTHKGIVPVDTLQAVRVWLNDKGNVLVDVGRNIVGWLQIKAQGEEGQPVVIRLAETLTTDQQTVYTDNLRHARCTNTYIPRDNNTFTYCPSTVYQGFRYAEITGLTSLPQAADIQGIVIADDMPVTGSFTCSDTILNRLFEAAKHGIQGNYHGFPTDCPQRDERLGWLGDRFTGCFGESMIFDNHNLYLKWLQDIEETQNEEGQIADIAPEYWGGLRHANVTWTGTYISVAYMLYERFGIEDGFRLHYPSMRQWLQYTLKESMRDSLLTVDTYGDWCMPPEDLYLIHSKDPSRITNDTVLSTAVFYGLLEKMQLFASLLGKEEDRVEYQQLAKNIRNAFNKKFYHYDTGGYDNQTLTANLLGLALGLVPEGEEEKTFNQIVNTTENLWHGHVSCGVIGIQHLMRTLTRRGRGDIAYLLATRTDYPSWGYMLTHGATTIWELWNGDTANPAMNSGNHVMLLGDLLLWYFEDLAGIRPDDIAYRHLTMQPYFPAGLDFVNATYQSVDGPISSHWVRQNDNTVKWHISLPGKIKATVITPDGNKQEIQGDNDIIVTLK
ncbi:MAG: family 78 glycoside hydrolase catalytic domain [Paludibacteraceae bacterium]|nr:family 78 glycoside hydrolase catalytic domain [Paludibacteraceae bacterium]